MTMNNKVTKSVLNIDIKVSININVSAIKLFTLIKHYHIDNDVDDISDRKRSVLSEPRCISFSRALPILCHLDNHLVTTKDSPLKVIAE